VKADLNQPRRPLLARLVRRIWQTAGRPWRRGQDPRTVEVLVWRGRFRFAGSRKYALVQDLTTRIHPELHTPGNVAEFEDYLQYALRHADLIATVSESSRRDIVSRLDVFPGSVAVMPVPVNPVYLQPSYDPALPRAHGLMGRYLLHVGTAEPRKNLRRLVRAFEWLLHHPEACGLTLALAGPAGWDEGFERFLVESDAYRRVQRLGFVPLSHLPSLYHYASAVVCASVYEGFGLPVLEALCCSAVVATSRTSSLPAIVGEGEDEGAITFDPYSTREMTDALLTALRLAPAEAAHHRRRARARAETWLAEAQGRPALPGLGAD
jgi:glycosyltransferase involved in cell wall biosynthesis